MGTAGLRHGEATQAGISIIELSENLRDPENMPEKLQSMSIVAEVTEQVKILSQSVITAAPLGSGKESSENRRQI